MAQSATQLDPETFSCFLCVELLKDPLTTSCGHTYCKGCLEHHWDAEEELRVYSCPQCKRTFKTRPVLEKDTMVAALVEILEKTGLRPAPADDGNAGAEGVACIVCNGRKRKALKSCVDCRASYCDPHLQPHRGSTACLKHRLVEPTKELRENICPRHDEVMKMFCRTDEQNICYLCPMDEHKGHDVTTVAALERQREREEAEWRSQQIRVTGGDVSLPEPKSREDFLRYACPITLDVNTLNDYLKLSEGKRKVVGVKDDQWYSEHPERFTYWAQVLSDQSLTGRCYWEVAWTGEEDGIDVAVAYRDIRREGDTNESRFGSNDKSWSLVCYFRGGFDFYHKDVLTAVSGPVSSTVGVYLDHRAGLLSFYGVFQGGVRLLHRVQTTFTQPLHAGLSVFAGSTAQLV